MNFTQVVLVPMAWAGLGAVVALLVVHYGFGWHP